MKYILEHFDKIFEIKFSKTRKIHCGTSFL